MKKINVAVCISGEPRSSMLCYPYIAESFINLDPNYYNVDVYLHTRKIYRAIFLYNPKGFMLDGVASDKEFWDKNKVKLPKELNDNMIFFAHYTANSSFLENQLLMLEGIVKSFELTSPKTKEYDLYIRCRPDIITDTKISIDDFAKDIVFDKKYDILFPSKGILKDKSNNDARGTEYNDQFSIGNYKSMMEYCNMSKNMNFLINKTKEFKVEKWLKEQLDSRNIKVSTQYLPFHLARGTRIFSNRGGDNFDFGFTDD